MRRLFTVAEAAEGGITKRRLRTADARRTWCRRIDRNVYGDGPHDPTPLDLARAGVIASRGVALGPLSGVLRGLDGVLGVPFDVDVGRSGNGRRAGARRPTIGPEHVTQIHGVPCGDAPDTLIRLSKYLDDLRWEQALESALRQGMSLEQLVETLARRPTARTVDRRRIERVLALRPADAAPTGSFLETCMVQLCRTVPGLPAPTRQREVHNVHGVFVARVDLAWDDLGLFSELDGQQHKGQPVYDSRREGAVVAATGWLVVRKTYYEVVRIPRATARQIEEIAAQARRRRFVLP